jgi:hypothetical protein
VCAHHLSDENRMDKYLRSQNGMVRNESSNRIVVDVYDVERRLELVSKRIRESREIAERNKQLIFKFANCILQGLSKLRAVFYLNRFWNTARLVDKDFPCRRERCRFEHVKGWLCY